MNAIGVAFAYAVLALFAQNAIFTRGLGVSRLIQLVGDERTMIVVHLLDQAVRKLRK